jgi:error-prone DNA polymerase
MPAGGIAGWNLAPHAPTPRCGLALRLGLRQIAGFRAEWAEAIAAARRAGAFTGLEDLARRAALPPRALRLLADADACASLGLDRRRALWEARRTPCGELPLFAAARLRDGIASEMGAEPETALPAATPGEEVAADYQMMRLSLRAHPMALLRPHFAQHKVLPCEALHHTAAGRRVRVAGVVLTRQRPGKGNAIFITLEDETGVANIVLWARQFEKLRRR